MQVEGRKKPSGENKDPKLRAIRRAMSRSIDKYSIGGQLKTGGHAPRPVTLPTIKFTEPTP